MKTWFKRKFPAEYLEDVSKQGEENIVFIYTEEIRRAYAHIQKVEALLDWAGDAVAGDDEHVKIAWTDAMADFKDGK